MESFEKTPQNGVFAIRNIGNQIVTNEGSIDFGVRILKTPFLLIGLIKFWIESSSKRCIVIKKQILRFYVKPKYFQKVQKSNKQNVNCFSTLYV